MPSSYQAPMRGEKPRQATFSQSVASNTSNEVATVSKLLAQKGGDIFAIRPGDTLHRAVEVLRDKRIGALVVTDQNGSLVGILSERDIVRKLADAPGKTLPHKVEEVMTSAVEVCAPSEPMVSVLRRMTQGKFRHMPVVDNGRLVGMVTIGDVVNYRLIELEHEALQLKQMIVG